MEMRSSGRSGANCAFVLRRVVPRPIPVALAPLADLHSFAVTGPNGRSVNAAVAPRWLGLP